MKEIKFESKESDMFVQATSCGLMFSCSENEEWGDTAIHFIHDKADAIKLRDWLTEAIDEWE